MKDLGDILLEYEGAFYLIVLIISLFVLIKALRGI